MQSQKPIVKTTMGELIQFPEPDQNDLERRVIAQLRPQPPRQIFSHYDDFADGLGLGLDCVPETPPFDAPPEAA